MKFEGDTIHPTTGTKEEMRMDLGVAASFSFFDAPNFANEVELTELFTNWWVRWELAEQVFTETSVLMDVTAEKCLDSVPLRLREGRVRALQGLT